MQKLVLPKLHWIPSPNFSKRGAVKVDLVVLHDTEGGYTGAISWFSKPQSRVSAHFVLREDGAECAQMVHLDDKAWHAVKFNSRSIGIEMAGFAKRGFDDKEWGAAAAMIAFLCSEFEIPVQWARHGKGPGFCSHYDLGQNGGGHQDPTTDSKKWADFVDMVVVSSRSSDIPTSWPFADPGRAALDHSALTED